MLSDKRMGGDVKKASFVCTNFKYKKNIFVLINMFSICAEKLKVINKISFSISLLI